VLFPDAQACVDDAMRLGHPRRTAAQSSEAGLICLLTGLVGCCDVSRRVKTRAEAEGEIRRTGHVLRCGASVRGDGASAFCGRGLVGGAVGVAGRGMGILLRLGLKFLCGADPRTLVPNGVR
jgi:hypothetical protein